jgi:hypothetical protein
MQSLKEIIYLLSQHNINPFEHLREGDGRGGKSKLLALFEGVRDGEITSDSNAEKKLYGGLGSNAYRKLKSDIKGHLIDAILDINTFKSDFSDYQKAYYDCHKRWLVVRILAGMHANLSAMEFAEKLLSKSSKFDFTFLCLDITSFLRIQYGLRESNSSKYREMSEMFDRFRGLYDAECLAEQMYTELIVTVVNKRGVNREIHDKATAAFEQIKPLMDGYGSYKLQMYGYLVGLIRFTSVKDYASAIAFCDEAIAFFNERPYEARTPLQIFHYQNLIGNIQMGRFFAGQVSAHECLRFLQEGTFNWFKYQELFLSLCFHSKEYEQADKTLQMIFGHPRFQFLPDNAKEIWSIYESYLYFLHNMGQVESKIALKFKLDRFERSTPIFSKDKGGLNVAIIIVRILILLAEKKHRKFIDEVDAINQYCYRHLRGEQTKRSYYFIKMLLVIPFAQFDAKQVEIKTKLLRQKMEVYPFNVENQANEFEIVPLETLWNLILARLGK